MRHQARPMRFLSLPAPGHTKPCQICVSHKPNADGYLYKTWAVGGRKVREPFYRFMLRASLGWDVWPEGLEAHHLCGVRQCCEPSHLEPIGKSSHKTITNLNRYKDRLHSARDHWESTSCTGTDLAQRYAVTVSTACRWIRTWNAPGQTPPALPLAA